jgi:hypothetical protein
MLEEVIADLAGDGEDDAVTAPEAVEFKAAPAPEPAAPAANTSGIMEALARELAARDEQIAELQHAVMELAEMRQGVSQAAPEPVAAFDPEPLHAALADLTRRIETLETRTSDQNEAIRHVLTMLIEWLEAENASARAA